MEQGSRKILQIFASAGWGGGERYVLDLATEQIARGERVTFVSRREPLIERAVRGLGDGYHVLPLKGAIDWWSAVRLAFIVRRMRPDVIHVHNFKDAFTAVRANSMAGSPAAVVLSRHQVKPGKNDGLHRRLYSRLDKMVFVSRLAQEKFLSSGVELPEGKACVVYNSIRLPERIEEGENLRARYGLAADTPLVVFTGRLVPEKGADVLIEAMAAIPGAACVVVGSGDEEYVRGLHALAAQHGVDDRVFFHGYCSDVFPLVVQADVGVVPSRFREPFGLSVIEFMALGKPVVTTDNGGQKEYMHDGEDGLLVPPEDASALAGAVGRLLADGQLRRRIGENAARTFRETLSYDVFYRRMKDVYDAALAGRKRRVGDR